MMHRLENCRAIVNHLRQSAAADQPDASLGGKRVDAACRMLYKYRVAFSAMRIVLRACSMSALLDGW
jgi:hypothetical protein